MNKFAHGGNIYNTAPLRHDFSVNLNPLGMPGEVVSAIRENADKLSAYPDPDSSALRFALAQKHGVPPESILCGNGAADLIIRLAMALHPKTVLTLAPGFSEYERAAQLCGAGFKTHALRPGDDFLLTAAVLDALSPDVGLIFLCNPNNPTGRLADPALLAAVLKKCEQTGAILAMDECFLEFTNAPSMTAHISSQNLVVINALTKTYAMAGLRLGYMLTKNDGLLRRVSSFSQSWPVSSAAQCAGLAALKCEDYLQKAKTLIASRRPDLSSRLAALGIHVFPSDANFLLCKSPVPLCEKLLKRGIMVRNASNFLTLDERYFRVCVSDKAQNDLLIKEISEVLNG